MPTRYDQLRLELAADPKVWLVTGVAGFIGSNLLEQLLGLGQRVIGLDDLSTGFRSNVDSVLAAQGAGATSRFEMIVGDIRNLETCHRACQGVDYVLHQAALGSVPRSIADPVTSSQVNVDGFLHMLVAARDARVKRFVYASSSSVYGDGTEHPQVEERTGRVLSPYAATKATNEMFAAVFQRTYGLEVAGLRYFNVFGRRQDPDGAYAAVVPRWVAGLLRGQPCRIFGDGETSRDFCYIENAVQANLLAATTVSEGSVGQVYNVACGQSTSLNSLFLLIRDGLLPYNPSISSQQPVYEDFRPGDVRRSLASIDKARRLLGYEPSHLVGQGLSEALDWYATSLGK